MPTDPNFDALEKGDDLHHRQLERQVDRTDKQVHTLVTATAALTMQRLSAESQRAEMIANRRQDSVAEGAARAIQTVVASPGFLP